MLTTVTRTHPGRVRTNNEDLALWDPDVSALALADGMGGHNAGEVASRIAIETLDKFLRQGADEADARWPFGFDHAQGLAANRLRTAVTVANREVLRSSEERAEFTGMGTTLTAAIVEGAHVTFSSVGDTRLYVFRDSQLQQLTKDDSLVGALAGIPGIDPKALEHHPMRNLLTNVLGRRPDVGATVDELELTDGQLLLLSTDGMHGAVPNESMRAILAAEPDLDRAGDLLVRTALEADGRDNITIVLARFTA